MAQPHIGLLGGSFDPVHLAHTALANCALEQLHLDQVQLIPAGDPWQRAPLKADASHRLAMLKVACAPYPSLMVNPIELERSGPTYTLETLLALPTGPRYFWILGADQLHNFCSWRGWQQILEQVELAVAARPGTPNLAPPDAMQRMLETTHRRLHYLSFTPSTISATEIRQRLQQGRSTTGMLDPAVFQYIQAHELYEVSRASNF